MSKSAVEAVARAPARGVTEEADEIFGRLMGQIYSFSEVLAREHIKVGTDFHESSLSAWRSYSSERKRKIFEDFCRYSSLIREVLSEGVSLLEHKRVVWAAMRILRMRPPHDAFSFLRDDEVIEIYNRDHIQIFRNVKFFELCGYSVFDVLVQDWPSLYDRKPADITPAIFKQTELSFEVDSRSEYYQNIPDHILHEKFSSDQRKLLISMGMHAPVYDLNVKSPVPMGVLVSLRAQIVHHYAFCFLFLLFV